MDKLERNEIWETHGYAWECPKCNEINDLNDDPRLEEQVYCEYCENSFVLTSE